MHLITEVSFLTLRSTSKRTRNSMLLNSLCKNGLQVHTWKLPGKSQLGRSVGRGTTGPCIPPLSYRNTRGFFLQMESCRSGKAAQAADTLFHFWQRWQCRNNSACSHFFFKPVLRQSSMTYILRKHPHILML